MTVTGLEPTTTSIINEHSTKWLSVGLLTKWLWVPVQLQSLELQIPRLLRGKEFLEIQATIECGFTLKRGRDMIRTYSKNTFALDLI